MFCNISINMQALDVDFETWSSDDEYDYFYVRYFSRRKNEEACLPKVVPDVQDTIPPGGIPKRRFFNLRFRRIQPRPKRVARPSRRRSFAKLISRIRFAKRAHKGVMTLPLVYPYNIPLRRRKAVYIKRKNASKSPDIVRFQSFVEELGDTSSSSRSSEEVFLEGTTPVHHRSVQTPLFTGLYEWDDELVHVGKFQLRAPSDLSVEGIGSVKPLGDSGISPLERLSCTEYDRQDVIGTLKGTISNLSDISSVVCQINDPHGTPVEMGFLSLICLVNNPGVEIEYTSNGGTSAVKNIIR